MTIKIILDEHSNEYGRRLVQDGEIVYIQSGCCFGAIDDATYLKNGEMWAKCMECNELLEKNSGSWTSRLPYISDEADSRPDSWAPWGEFWFGLKNFAMHIETS